MEVTTYMLQIKNICKEYKTGTLIQKALDDVSLNLRDNEFVAILGPSGSGKSTLLNIIGGLDHYDSGDLIINGISTKQYTDRDWDSYRNHTIGFIFQSYNLIPHQTVLANVELALTISGIGKAKRRELAVQALEQVGLGDQIHKKPNQMSGGQMQRVAIARALVNDPDILLADEPTGALDSETSVQVMQLLQEVAKDRLVVMVTHNPELADEYATRIVKLRDGKICSDSKSYEVQSEHLQEPEHKNMGKAYMSFGTALSLSFNNLRTKKARTLLTSFAGSIGIIGIALILALSTGVSDYIKNVEKETLSEYPLQIQNTGFDITSVMVHDDGGKESGPGDVGVINMVTDMFSKMNSNDLASLKKYLDSGESGIEKHTSAVEYSYQVTPQIYRQEGEDIRQVNPDRSFEALGFSSAGAANSMMSSFMGTNIFYEMPKNMKPYEKQYDVRAGRWPKSANECVVVLTSNGKLSDFMLYSLGLRDTAELDQMIQQFIDEEDVSTPKSMGSYTYQDILGTAFKLVDSGDYYEYDSQYQVWKDKSGDKNYMRSLVENGEDIKVVGVVQPSEGGNAAILSPGIAYPEALTRHVVENAEKGEIVRQQLENPEKNVFTNEPFGVKAENDGFDNGSLFKVDEEAIQKAFGFDESALSDGLGKSMDLGNAFDFGGDMSNFAGMVDLSQVELNLGEMPQMNLGEIMSGLDVSVSSEGLGQMASSLMEGYKDYAKSNPEADYSGLGQDIQNFLSTPEAQTILSEHIRDIIQSNGGIEVSTEMLQEMLQELMVGYMEYMVYMEDQGVDAWANPEQHMMDYLQKAKAQGILEEWAGDIFKVAGNVTITPEQIRALSQDLAAGYQRYTAANGLPDPSKIGEHYIAYMNTPDGQRRLTEGIAGAIDLDSLGTQISGSVEGYMQKAMGAYTGAISQALETQVSSALKQIVGQISGGLEGAMQQTMSQVGTRLQSAMGDAMSIDQDAFAEAFQMNMTGEELAELMMSMGSAENASYDNNLQKLGYVDFAVPSSIDLYPLDFESKGNVIKILDDYNGKMEKQGKEEQVITYTDMVGTLMSSVTEIIDVISYVLIAFVAISLVVSSIMIGVITYISVLERKKEIGILRAIGASKGNISQIFNAETFIIGLCAGVLGIGISLILLIPGNMLIHHLAERNDISAVLPAIPAVVLILISVLLTLLGGLIPSRKAAKSDPVTALRTE